MQKELLIKKIREGLERFSKLPAKEQLERLIKRGIIDEKGRVLMNGEKPEKR